MKERVKFNNVLVGRRRVNSFLIGGKVSINLFSSSQRVKVKNLDGEFKLVRGRKRVKFVNFLKG